MEFSIFHSEEIPPQGHFQFSIKKGFTLLELLVVISIIGILIAMGTVSYTTAQKKGRDSRRKSDLKAIQNAMEECYSLTSSYPVIDISSATSITCGGETPMSSVPRDPKGGSCSYHGTSTATSYTFWADLEQSANGCNGSLNSDDFSVSNLQ